MKLMTLISLAVALTASFAFADRGSRYNRGDSWDYRSSAGYDRGHRYDHRGRSDSRWSFSFGLSTSGYSPSHHYYAPPHRYASVRHYEPRTVMVREPVVIVREPTVIVRDPVIVRESSCGPSAIVTERVVVREPVYVAPRSYARVDYRSSAPAHRQGWSYSGRIVYRH